MPRKPIPEINVRIGTTADVHDMMLLALAGSGENGFVNPEPSKLLQEIYSALSRHHGLMGIIGKPGRPEGAILLRIGEMWYSTDKVLEEKAIFIHPDFRAATGGRAKHLCAFAKAVSDSLGIPLVIGVLSNHRTEVKIKLYERQFGSPAGAFFLYGAATGAYR